MAQEDDLRALGKIMDFLRAVSIILAIMNVYWYCYEAMHMWGVTIGVVDRILINFNRTGGKYFISRHYKIFCVNGNTGFKFESRIFYFIHLQNEEDYEKKESRSA